VQPISIEELLAKQKQKEEEESKPKFMTRAERERLALEKREAAVLEQKKKLEEIRKTREEFFEQAKEETKHRYGYRDRDRRYGRRDRYRDRDRDRDRRRDRDRDRGDRRDRDRRKDEKKRLDRQQEKEKELIKNHYLGIKKAKKKIIKPSEKFKFVFSWDLADDTSRDTNPLYNKKQEFRPLFGRGFYAGIDQREQLQKMEKGKDRSRMARLDKKLASHYLGKGDTGKHWTEKSLEEMTNRDWRIFKEDFNISCKGGAIPHPIRNWKESNLPPELLEAVTKCGYVEPMPIQMQAIPIGLQHRDIIGVAETGSGKTAAFVLPMLVYISTLPDMTPETEVDGPYAVILAPVRELALQIEDECKKFADCMNIRTVSVVGGQSIEEQGFYLRKGCEVVVATPGRLKDCLDRRYVVLNQCNYVVLDEADRMIDMGFEPQVMDILNAMPATTWKSADAELAAQQEKSGIFRTTTMYSATMPVAVERLARKYLRRPAYIVIGEAGKAVDKIKQTVVFTKNTTEKTKKLTELLYTGIQPPIMIFANQKKICDLLLKHLEKLGFRATVLHAGKRQEHREESMEGFKSGKYDILVSTDVAGRGIDVKGVTHVINFDMPKTISDYTHRIGRTGRAGLEGIAVSYITSEDTDIMYDLKQMLQATGNAIPHELQHHPASFHKPGTIPDRQKRRDQILYIN